MIRKTLMAALLALSLTFTGAVAQRRAEFKDGTLKIAQFTDVHWSDKSPRCADTRATIESVLRSERPDLVVLSGDIVTYEPAMDGWRSVTAIFEKAAVPYVVLMGNHDPEWATKKEIYEFLATCPHFVGERGDESITGYGNAVMPVYGGKNGGAAPEALLYFLDSGDYPKDKKNGSYDWIHFDQIAWYRRQSELFTRQNNGTPLPALAYFHIPLPEYKEVIGKESTYGIYNEGEVCSPDYNSGMFNAIIEEGDIMATFVGHDHDNDYLGLLNGVVLAYGRKTGFDSYGSLQKGARIVLLYEGERRFDTWVATPKGKEKAYHYQSGLLGD